ncbi:MAG: class I SAM-dependent methyltransferase [candidate division Zixibacteria bacterium]|nr:class I SAM-dependent methyltransferase [candidate division Zixibacteria bacterium]
MSHDKHMEFFDMLAAEWDLMFTAEDMERLSHIVDNIDVENGMNIVDIGCGTGILFDMLRRKAGLDGSVTGVDFSLQMAVRAHRNFPFSNVNVVDADAIELPFVDSCFDIGVAFSSFPHFSNQQRAISEIHRVLKDGAKFHIIHLVSSKELSEIHQRIGGVVEHDSIPQEETLRKMFNSSRFSNVAVMDHPGLYFATAVNSK